MRRNGYSARHDQQYEDEGNKKRGLLWRSCFFEDMFGSVEVLVFPSALNEYGAYLTEGQPIVMKAKLSRREEEDAKLLCESVLPLQEEDSHGGEAQPAKRSSGKRPGLYLKVPSGSSPRYQRACQLLELFEGATPVYIYYNDVRKLYSLQ